LPIEDLIRSICGITQSVGQVGRELGRDGRPPVGHWQTRDCVEKTEEAAYLPFLDAAGSRLMGFVLEGATDESAAGVSWNHA